MTEHLTVFVLARSQYILSEFWKLRMKILASQLNICLVGLNVYKRSLTSFDTP